MQYIRMSFRGFEFDANPESLTASYTKTVSKRKIPFSSSITQETGKAEAVIKGKGCFAGEGAMEKAYEMLRIFNKKGSDYLFCASAVPLRAFFSELDISYSSGEDKVDYSFTFIQDSDEGEAEYDFGYAIAGRDENAFDIACRTGISVEKIAELNELEDLFAIREGDKIWLA